MDPDAPDDLILKPCMERLKIIIEDGLETSPVYVWTLAEICLCYIALGQAELAKKYREMIIPQLPRWPEPQVVPNFWVMEEIVNNPDVTEHQFWRNRVDILALTV
jgi:hypothetical protein